MRGGAHLTDRDRVAGKDEGPPLPPLATGLVLGAWVSVLLVLALVVVPALFASCTGPAPG